MVRLVSTTRVRAKPVATPDHLAGKSVELEIALCSATPRIWRRFAVPGDIKLSRLHAVIQVIMGWTDSHLHAFRQGNHEYTAPDPDAPNWQQTPSDVIIHDERRHTLGGVVARQGDTFQYEYDFGDGWEHDLRAIRIESAAERLKRARCLAGARACPPEDCGGIGGFQELLAALAGPRHPRHAEITEWLGRDYDPARFDLDEVNEVLQKVRV